MSKTVYIRVDANKVIATGHVMRCISIATELKEQGSHVIFIVADTDSENLINSKGFDTLCLNSIWNQLDLEIEKMAEIIEKYKIDILLIDTYYVTERYLNKLSKLTRVFYIDDLDMFIYPVDMVINYSIYADEFNYEDRYKAKGINTRFFLGCHYTPLRREFYNISYTVKEKVENILITTGGTDNFNVAGELTNRLIQDVYFNNIKIHIVSGVYNSNRDSLYQLAGNNDNIVIHENESNMAKLILSCDIAITAGGTTLYELCACGIPTIAVSFADNQLHNVRRFQQEKLLKLAGDVRNGMSDIINNVIMYIKDFAENKEKREQYSIRMRKKNVSEGSKCIAHLLIGED